MAACCVVIAMDKGADALVVWAWTACPICTALLGAKNFDRGRIVISVQEMNSSSNGAMQQDNEARYIK